MKKLLIAGLILIVSAFTLNTDNNNITQKDFEGIITYDIEYIEVPSDVEDLISMFPETMRMYIKDSKVKIYQDVIGGSQVIVSDSKTKEGFILMDLMGQKIAVKIDKEDVEKEEKNMKPSEVTYVDDETKVIAGYTCKKALVKNGETGGQTTVYYTEEIQNSNKDYSFVKGMPLQYTTKEDDMVLRMTASNIEQKKLGDDLFVIPDGYEVQTIEELEEGLDD